MFDHRESGWRPQEALSQKTKIPKTRVTRKTRKILFRKLPMMESLMKTRLVIIVKVYHVRDKERSSPILIAQFWEPGLIDCFQNIQRYFNAKTTITPLSLSYNRGKVLPPDITQILPPDVTKANSDPKGGDKEVNWVCPFLSGISRTCNIIQQDM